MPSAAAKAGESLASCVLNQSVVTVNVVLVLGRRLEGGDGGNSAPKLFIEVARIFHQKIAQLCEMQRGGQ